ncbi:YqzL family protein [Sutcliffiella rhizosphaerae]|nr:YqzL family protein [Sutcliffiella rhizosphaerae]
MLDFTWKIFKETGNIDTYLLFKELEKDNVDLPEQSEELANRDLPIS